MNNNNNRRWLTSVEAAEYLNLSTAYLYRLRTGQDGPPFVVIGGRKGIRYAVDDLNAWMEQRRQAGASSRAS